MKLATALSERASLQTKLQELSLRLNNNAKMQEGEPPAEDPAMLMSEVNEVLQQLEELIVRINLTNSTTTIRGCTITEYIARRDVLKQRIKLYRDFLNLASLKVERYSQKEIRILSTVNVSQLQKQLDGYSKELREVEETLQEANWTTELK